MKTNKLKNLLKIVTLSFGVSLFFFSSCEKDDTFDENISTVQKSNVIAKRVTLNEIKENQTLKRSLDKIEKQFDYFKKGNEFSKINSTNNLFSILTDEILQVTTDSTEAYTFRIETPTHSNSAFENFVIEKRNDSDYDFYIYRYKRLELEENTVFTYLITKELVGEDQINLGGFQDVFAFKVFYDSSRDCYYSLELNFSCDCLILRWLECESGGGGSGGGGGGGSSGGSTGGSTGTGSGSTGGTGGLGGNNGGEFGDDSGDYTGGGYGGSGGSSGGSGGPNSGSGSGGSTIGVLPSPLDLAIDNFFNNLTDEQEECLNTTPQLSKDVRTYLVNNIGTYLQDEGTPSTNPQDFATLAMEAVCNSSNNINNLSEYIASEIDSLTNSNPFLLLEIDCNQIENWQTLAQHTAPQSVQNKINNLPSNWANDFEIQPLDEANGTVVNLDYFSVNIASLPNNPATGQQFTANGLLDYMRRDFNNFVEGSTFEPYCEIPSMCQTETDLWNSNNPIGSIIYIDIPGDDGVVVCTEYQQLLVFYDNECTLCR